MANSSVKTLARELVERLPESATWDDVEYEIYVRRAIDAGLKDSDTNDVMPVEDVRRAFALTE